ncbi:DUF4157 domain-containing protein [Corallococcus sicarius]|uniref:DUF4157 domain-containing protein n=1 Tax=Corallococcus sicarius TaxID=2316726 RepID=A0A3A8MGL2_9BACT|nr:DUF4157 domain-containing protein [Corallococcus sicarius]RKH27835.1 DUF4157 domain-containing protein [Corallococcus sicarius]
MESPTSLNRQAVRDTRVAPLTERVADAGHGLFTGIAGASAGAARSAYIALMLLAGGMARCAAGRSREGLPQLKRGLFRVAQMPVDLVLMLGGRVLSAVQVVSGLEPVGRRLTDAEVARLKPIFGDSVDFRCVRVKEGALGLLGLPGRAFAHGDILFIPPGYGAVGFRLLVHELTHVWQHQHGGTGYLSGALAAQYLGDGYDWRKAVGAHRRWAELNAEQQAQFIEDAADAQLIPHVGRPTPQQRLRGWSDAALCLLDEALDNLYAGRGAP